MKITSFNNLRYVQPRVIYDKCSHARVKMLGLKRARQSFTFEYKLKVIAHVDEIGNRAAAKEFEIDELMIRYWRKKKDVKTKLPKRQCRILICFDFHLLPPKNTRPSFL